MASCGRLLQQRVRSIIHLLVRPLADPFGFIQGQKTNSIGVFNGTQWTPLTPTQLAALINALIDHGLLLGLPDDDHTQYALLAGRSGGQVLKGGTAAGNSLTLVATSGAGAGSEAIILAVGNDGATIVAIVTSALLAVTGGITATTFIEATTTINAGTGYRVAGGAASGNVLRGNGTNFVSSTLSPSDLVGGAWTAVGYTAGDYTADTGTWTVDSGDLIAFSYVLIGKTMHISWVIATSSNSSAAATRMEILIPGGKSANRRVVGHGLVSENGTDFNANVQVIPSISATKILIFKNAGASLTYAANTNVLTILGSITLETT